MNIHVQFIDKHHLSLYFLIGLIIVEKIFSCVITTNGKQSSKRDKNIIRDCNIYLIKLLTI